MQSGYQVPVFALQNATIATNTGDTTKFVNQYVSNNTRSRTFHAMVIGTGAVSATILLETSNDGVHWITPGLTTFSLTGTTIAQAAFASVESWAFVRANITAISGTGAAVTVLMGL